MNAWREVDARIQGTKDGERASGVAEVVDGFPPFFVGDEWYFRLVCVVVAFEMVVPVICASVCVLIVIFS